METNKLSRSALIPLSLALFFSGCFLFKKPVSTPPPAPSFRLLAESEYPRFRDDLPLESLKAAAEKSLRYLKRADFRTFRIGATDYSREFYTQSIQAFLQAYEESKTEEELNQRILREFDIYQSAGSDGAGKVVFSGYYEPTLEASPQKNQEYPYPIYSKPPDLIEARLEDFDSKGKGERLLGRIQEGKLVPYFNRREIDQKKALEGKGLELAWLKSRFDVLNLHIEGSGRLIFPDGSQKRAQFAATNGLPYKSPAMILVEAGALKKEEINHEKVRQYFKENPQAEEWVISHNNRYTFFILTDIPADSQPLGAMGHPLTPGRSIAFDSKTAPLGVLAYMETKLPSADSEGGLLAIAPSSRFVFTQDIGGAIKGPGRVDLFLGSGPQAHKTATNLWETGRLYLILKKLPPRER